MPAGQRTSWLAHDVFKLRDKKGDCASGAETARAAPRRSDAIVLYRGATFPQDIVRVSSSARPELFQLVADERSVVKLVGYQVEQNPADGLLAPTAVRAGFFQNTFRTTFHESDGGGVGLVEGGSDGGQIRCDLGRMRFLGQDARPCLNPGQHPGLGPGEVRQVL